MSIPGETPSRGNLLDFMTEFNGTQPEVSPLELVAVTAGFKRLFQSLLGDHITAVDEPSGWQPGLVSRLHLEVPVDDELWTADLGSLVPPANETELKPEDLPRQLIDLKRVVGTDIRDTFSYVLTADDIVRRYDAGDIYANELLQAALGEDLPTLIESDKQKSLEEVLLELHEGVEFNRERQQSDEDNRLNNQPIGLTELDGLELMLTGPNVTAGYPTGKTE